jgi:hypothetical protein
MQVFQESIIRCGQQLADDSLSHFLVDSASESCNANVVSPGLASGKEKETFEFSSELCKRGAALAQSVQSLVRLLNELPVSKEDIEVLIELFEYIGCGGSRIYRMNSDPGIYLAPGVAGQSVEGVPYAGEAVSDDISIDSELGSELGKKG